MKWSAQHWEAAKADSHGVSNTNIRAQFYKISFAQKRLYQAAQISELYHEDYAQRPKDRAMDVMGLPIIILPVVLIAALCNWYANKNPGSIPSPFMMEDKKYNSDNRGIFELSSLAMMPQESICWATRIEGFLLKVPLQVPVLY